MASSLIQSARSLANKYEMTLLESHHKSQDPSIAQLQECFRIFNEIIPSLGQYQRVMRLIRNDVYEAVFSREYTIDIGPPDRPGVDTIKRESGDVGKSASITRVPHFVILNKIVDERNKRAEDAEQEVKELKAVIDELNGEISMLHNQVDEFQAAIVTRNKEIENLTADLVNETQESTRLREALRAQHEEMTGERKSLERTIEAVNAELTKETAIVRDLSRFKKCHDHVQDSFRDPSVFSPNPQKTLFLSGNTVEKLRKDMSEGRTLEKQLLKLRNTCIGEYEEYLEKEALEGPLGHPFDGIKTEERRRNQTAFTNMIANIENELQQNELHVSTLNAELKKLSKIEKEPLQTKAKVVQFSQRHSELGIPGAHAMAVSENSGEKDESDLLEVVKNADSKYLPQEMILNKYAITAHYSCNKGETFHELQHVQLCRSCGQKTLVCPHKASTGERVFHLPLQCTHIKFTRPELAITTNKDNTDAAKTPSDSSHPMAKSKNVYARLWKHLETRKTSIPYTQRVIQEKRLVSLINQFYASLVSDDSSEDELAPLLELWHCFLNDRYQVPSVAVSVAKDTTEAMLKCVHSNRFVRLFADSLCGNLDPTSIRYYLILSHLVQSIQWTSMEDFSHFVQIFYPFMSIDDVEQFTMSYTSFSENKVSAKLICEFFLSVILKQREPSFHDMENMLLNHCETNTGSMSDVVFFEAMTELSPLSSERLSHRLFAQSKADGQADHVSITRLSQIGSFLDLHQRSAVIEMELKEKLQLQT